MPRHPRVAPGGQIYHVINRAVARLRIFESDADYIAFEAVLRQALERYPIRVLAWTLMPNHFHFVVHPKSDGELTNFFRWLTHTHVMRYHQAHHTVGTGSLYQGRFKAFMIEEDLHLPWVMRYVLRNPVRANLVTDVGDWKWNSLFHEGKGTSLSEYIVPSPVPLGRNWLQRINRPETGAEIEAVRTAIRRGKPFGSEAWTQSTARRHALSHTLRAPNRPKKGDGAALSGPMPRMRSPR